MNDRNTRSSGAPEYKQTRVRARQAVIGNNVRYVLGFGLGAVILAFIIIYFIYFG
jgi:hypothetical protein